MSLDDLYFHKAMGYSFIGHYTPSQNQNFYKDLNECNTNIKECNLCQLCKIRQDSVLIDICEHSYDAKIIFVSLMAYDDIKRDIDAFKALIGKEFSNAYFSFLLKCITTRSKFENFIANNDINANLKPCKPYFDLEQKMLKPKIIIALGAQVFKALMGESGYAYTSVRGGLYRLGDMLVMPTHDLAFLAKNPSLKCEIIADLHKLKAFL